jgi:hypothetical protein
MIALYISSLTVFVCYVVALLWRLGVPTSISESYDLWPHGRGRWLFGGFCLLVALPLMAFWIETSPEAWRFLAFLGCAPLAFVGAAGAFKELDLTGRVHFVAAGVSAAASQVWIALNCPNWWVGIALLLAGAGIMTWRFRGCDAAGRTRSAWLFWAEVAAFTSVYAAVLAYYISN